jgi:prepilin-type N-terminal cleavage/methylation domain-containing protein
MTPRIERPQSGFTLLEVLISVSVFLLVLGTIVVALDSNRGTYVRGESKMDAQQSVRLALGEIAREVRMAGYFPENHPVPSTSPSLGHPILVATHDTLAIHGDADGSGASHVFLYCLDGTTLRRGKAPLADATALWCPAGEILAENVSGLRFAYFGAENVPLPAAPDPPYALDDVGAGGSPDLDDTTERAAVQRVVVTLTVSETVRGQGPQVFTLGSEVRLRNAA